MKINAETKFSDLSDLGADRVGDVELTEWLEYVKNTCLRILKDRECCEEMDWNDEFTEAVVSIDQAINAINRAQQGPQ